MTHPLILVSPKLDGIDLEAVDRRFEWIRDSLAAAIEGMTDKHAPLLEPTMLSVPATDVRLHYVPALNKARHNRIQLVGYGTSRPITLAEAYHLAIPNDEQHQPLAILERITAIAGSVRGAIENLHPLAVAPWTRVDFNEALTHAQVYLKALAVEDGAKPVAFKIKTGRPYRSLEAELKADMNFRTVHYRLAAAEADLLDASLPRFASIKKTEKDGDLVYTITAADLDLPPIADVSVIDEMKAHRFFAGDSAAAA